ncbi:MAG: hypothetical protein ACP6IY_21730, partial [Promethearchaeia archaeon]
MHFEMFLLGLGICIIPLICIKRESKLFKIIYFLNFLFFGTVGTVILLINIHKWNFNTAFLIIICYLYFLISIIVIIFQTENKIYNNLNVIRRNKSLIKRLMPLIIFEVCIISLFSFLWLIWLRQPEFTNIYWHIIHQPAFITILLFLTFIILGISIYRFNHKEIILLNAKHINLTVYANKKAAIIPLIIIIFIFVNFLIYFSLDNGIIYIGTSESISESSEIIGNIYWAIMGDPLFIFVVVLILVGGLAKVVASGKASELV